jgi:hypothetical protein
MTNLTEIDMARQTPSRSTTKSKVASNARTVDPALNRPANADESSPEALVPEIVRSNLQENTSAGSGADLQERISQRAYELAAERGFAPGAAIDDWLRAEREILATAPRQAAPEDQFTG